MTNAPLSLTASTTKAKREGRQSSVCLARGLDGGVQQVKMLQTSTKMGTGLVWVRNGAKRSSESFGKSTSQ